MTDNGRPYVVVVCKPGSFHNVIGPFAEQSKARNHVRTLRNRQDYYRFKNEGGQILARPLLDPFAAP